MRELLATLIHGTNDGRAAIHCEVVETRGSTPQKPGSVMLVHADGSQAGTLGGGCTEAEVKRQALLLMNQSTPKLLTFSLDDNYGWDDGLICGGRMTFLAQPIDATALAYFRQLHDLIDKGAGATEALVIDEQKAGLPVGARILFDENNALVARLGTDRVPETLPQRLVSLIERPRPYAQQGFAFVPILPRCKLLIIGAGHVGQAVAALARQVDFDIWVLDDRERYANSDRFPMATRIWVEDMGRALASFTPDANTYCLIMTRGHAHDEEALFHLVGKPARYIGLIGSRRKIKLIFEDLRKDGVTDEALDKVHAPLGFDIGSQTVPEIALSIVSYLVGHRNRGEQSFPPTGAEFRAKEKAPETSDAR